MTITVQYVLNLFPQTLFKPPNVLIRRENRRTDLCRRPIPANPTYFLCWRGLAAALMLS